MNNFFLEGPIQIGKSTLIRRCLDGYKGRLGGFSSQRIREKDTGEILGFSLMPASDFNVEIILQKSELSSKSNLFLGRQTDSGAFSFDPEVFSNAGVGFLENYRDCDLMLLDEIGGVEMLVPSFRDKLYEVLESPVPCIGVLKGLANAGSSGSKKVLAENTLLRDFLTKDTNSEVISLTGKTFRKS